MGEKENKLQNLEEANSFRSYLYREIAKMQSIQESIDTADKEKLNELNSDIKRYYKNYHDQEPE